MNNLRYIVDRLPLEVRIDQLGEEAAELAHAASKLSRVLRGVNPTPVTRDEAEENLRKEVGDVLTCVAAVTQPGDMAECLIEWNMEIGKNAARWRRRLEERGRDGDGEKPVV